MHRVGLDRRRLQPAQRGSRHRADRRRTTASATRAARANRVLAHRATRPCSRSRRQPEWPRSKLYDVGTLPPELQLRWPKAPRTTREVKVGSLAEFESAAAQAGTRVVVTRDLRGGPATVNASDIDVVVRPGVHVDKLVIGPGQKRVAVHGGHYEAIGMTLPAQFWPTKVANPSGATRT